MSSLIWNKEYECLPRPEIEKLQLQRLKEVVSKVYEKVPFYRDLYDQHGVRPDMIKELTDISKLPLTTKSAMRDNYPYGLFAEPLEKMVRLHASSGTTGKPIVAGYTRKDLENWAELIARIVFQAGVTSRDIAQICFNYALFTGGFGLHYGLEKAGVTVIPASSGNSEKQLTLMQDFGTTVLVSTPSYALYLAEIAEEAGINPANLKVKFGLFGGEACSAATREVIEKRWQMKATINYGLTEVMGPGVSGECRQGEGMHISEDHFLAEIIDPVTEQPLGWGETGELVLTTLTKEGMPVIRYRTRDLCLLDPAPCACGRTTVRMGHIKGRSDDMLIINGVNVFPSQVETVLAEIPEVSSYYRIIVDRKRYLDRLDVEVELAEDKAHVFLEKYHDLETLETRIQERLKAVLSISAKIKLLEPKSIKRSTGKTEHIIDRRTD